MKGRIHWLEFNMILDTRRKKEKLRDRSIESQNKSRETTTSHVEAKLLKTEEKEKNYKIIYNKK